ncbi:MAG: M48 family peptidase, partial [Nocardioides sp.]
MTGDQRARAVGWATLALGLVGFALVAALVVPWQPVPGGMPDPAAPSTVFSAAEIARAESYSRVIRWLGWTSLGLSLAVAVILGFGPWGRRLIGRIPGRWWVQVTVGTIVLLGAGRLATLPITVVAWRWRTRWELTTQGLPGLLRDVVVGFAVSALVSCLVVLVVVGTARRLPRVWPAVAGGVLASAMLVISFGYPI